MKVEAIVTATGKTAEAILNSYAQVFFSKNKAFAFVLLAVSFFDYTAGIAGLLAVAIAILFANTIGLSRITTQSGQYSFNNLLMGLAIGYNFEPGWALFATVIIASVFTSLVTIAMQGWLTKYGLPYLSLPFILGTWVAIIASSRFSVLGLSARDIYNDNALYSLGGKWLHNVYYGFENAFPLVLSVYFKSLGAIFFQFNVLSGLLIAIAMLVYSRMAFVLSLLGYIIAIGFYSVMGIGVQGISYSYVGFNYILATMALGGYFLVPGKSSFVAALAMLPIVGLITITSESLLGVFQLSVYSLPFNITVLLFLYMLKYRTKETFGITEVPFQHFSPEKNFYFNYLSRKDKQKAGFLNLSLPFYGEWEISQGHSGTFTHKDEWQHAWDFVITSDGVQYKNEGKQASDYFCYGKPVLAAADGTVVELIDGIADNAIGEMNLARNWGNSIVICHSPGVFTQMSHLIAGSIKVKKGDSVIRGQALASVGNSGRSPYPHLHFQIQGTPFIGSKTMKYPIGTYLTRNNESFEMKFFDIPEMGEKVIKPATSAMISSAFAFVPGQKLKIKLNSEGELPKYLRNLEGNHTIEVLTDIYNYSYFSDLATHDQAWFHNDGSFHTFQNYEGRNNSFLKLWSLLLKKVYLGYYQNLELEDKIPVHFMFSGFSKLLHDVVAPFYPFMESTYTIKYEQLNDDFSEGKVIISGRTVNSVLMTKKEVYRFEMLITSKGIEQITVLNNQFKIRMTCEN